MNIYKVNHLTNENTIHSIHVFYGKHKEKLDQLFKKNSSNTVFTSIFTQEEINTIEEKNIPVYFSQQSIHPDDSIGKIKFKIFPFLNLQNFKLH